MAFWDRMESILNRGIEASKDVIDKARDKAKELGEIGVLKMELAQLEKEAQQALAKLGSKTYEFIETEQEIQLPADSAEFAALCQDIHELKEKIEEVEEQLKEA